MEVQELYKKYLESGVVSTDTRHIKPGSIFFALRGAKFNGNEFAAKALDSGASFAVVDEKRYVIEGRTMLVENVLNTLQALAKHHRKQLKIPVLGLTGSNGKTTTKELLKSVLSVNYKTFATQGNLNNHIGVPLSILSIDSSVQLAILEMGANHLGEIGFLCDIAQPTHGLITNIGKAHMGTFGGFDNVIRGKSELYQYLIDNNGIVFINSQNYILSNMAKRFNNPVMYPTKDDYYYVKLLEASPYVKVQTENGDEVQTQLMGTYNFENIATALCVGKFFGIDAKQANKAVASYVPANNRSQVIKKGNNTIVLDAYNANPSSMQAAIENLASMKVPRKVLILGDMYELGDDAEKEHRLIGALLMERNLKEVYLCGDHIKAAKEMLPHAMYFHHKEELIHELKNTLFTNATILIKASRSLGLEDVVEYI